MYACTYIHTYIYAYIHTYPYPYPYTHTHMHTTHAHTHTHTHTTIYTHITHTRQLRHAPRCRRHCTQPLLLDGMDDARAHKSHETAGSTSTPSAWSMGAGWARGGPCCASHAFFAALVVGRCFHRAEAERTNKRGCSARARTCEHVHAHACTHEGAHTKARAHTRTHAQTHTNTPLRVRVQASKRGAASAYRHAEGASQGAAGSQARPPSCPSESAPGSCPCQCAFAPPFNALMLESPEFFCLKNIWAQTWFVIILAPWRHAGPPSRCWRSGRSRGA